MRYAFAFTFAALCTIAVAAQTPAPQGDKPAAPAPAAQAASAGKVTYTGCLKPGAAADSWTLENAEMASAAGKPAATSGASKMTLGLSAKPTENLKPHANHKIEVTGTMSKAGGASSSSSSTTPSQTLAVESFKMVSATCP
jgi:hypothetical protein